MDLVSLVIVSNKVMLYITPSLQNNDKTYDNPLYFFPNNGIALRFMLFAKAVACYMISSLESLQ